MQIMLPHAELVKRFGTLPQSMPAEKSACVAGCPWGAYLFTHGLEVCLMLCHLPAALWHSLAVAVACCAGALVEAASCTRDTTGDQIKNKLACMGVLA